MAGVAHVSSKNQVPKIKIIILILNYKESIFQENNKGPSMDPWGTPNSISDIVDFSLSSLILHVIWEKLLEMEWGGKLNINCLI